MSLPVCLAAMDDGLLVEYWLGELDEARAAAIDEHVFGCSACTERLQALVGIGDGIRAMVRTGALHGVVSRHFLERLAGHGLRLREYRVAPGGSVNCTIAPDDDLVVSRLRAPLADVTRMDLVASDTQGRELERLHDIPFDAAADEIIYIPAAAYLRTLPATTVCMALLAMDDGGARQVGSYTFLHTPWPTA